MKSNELRIGNLVMCRGAISTITIIQQKSIGYFKNSFVGEDALPLKFIKPIPLTEEWLVNFGFKEIKRFTHDFEEIIYGKSIIVGSENHCETLVISMPFKTGFIGNYLSDEEYTLNIDINNVHQLQNLYFALTNEELTLQS